MLSTVCSRSPFQPKCTKSGIEAKRRWTAMPWIWLDFAGDLSSCRIAPIILKCANKLVYCPHVWGPCLSQQSYFQGSQFPGNMPSIWNSDWGHICTQKPLLGPACVIGKFQSFISHAPTLWLHANHDLCFVHYIQACLLCLCLDILYRPIIAKVNLSIWQICSHFFRESMFLVTNELEITELKTDICLSFFQENGEVLQHWIHQTISGMWLSASIFRR